MPEQLTRARDVLAHLEDLGDPAVAANSARFFKTGPGEYGEGDSFLGVRVPVLRRVAKKARPLPLDETLALLRSKWHEARLTAVIVLAEAYARGDAKQKKRIFDAYLAHTELINNWDIVDSSAHKIVGPHLEGRGLRRLQKLARSSSLWERRIAMIATLHEIKQGEFSTALAVAETLVADPEDLIHKAVGWMLREIGEQDPVAERAFLDRHAPTMPRTMLRYAIEKFPAADRTRYLEAVRRR